MLKYGEIIPGSVRRGYIKDIHVENGFFCLFFVFSSLHCRTKPNLVALKFVCLQTNNRTECFTVVKKNTPHTRVDKKKHF